MTLEKLLTVLILNTGLPGDGERMRKITIFGQPPKSNWSQEQEGFRKGLRTPGLRCPVIACKLADERSYYGRT
jgi:hypothetical protein